jgi:catechol 2,3-dioxygenase-like lactoylglutathione lyase family enzyme
MTIKKIQVVSVPVSDQDKAKEFYSNVLGLEVLQDMRMDENSRWIQLQPPGSEASITLVTWFPSMPPGSLKGLVLETDDLEGTISEMASEGFTIDAEIDSQPWGRFVSFDDPDGNGIVLRQPAEGGSQ